MSYEIDINIRNKEFKITLVNNYVHQKYSGMVENVGKLDTISKEIDELNRQLIAKEIERKVWKTEFAKLNAKLKETSIEIIEVRREIVKEILESNNLEYDQHFWLHKTDPDDINDFMIKCLHKDLSNTTNDKKVKKK